MSIEKRPNGQWRARWRESDGKQRARHFDRKLDAQNFLASVRVDTSRGSYIDPGAGRETVGEYAPRWAESQAWRESSRDRMTHVIRAHIVPAVGTMQLRAVRRSDVQAWVGRMTSAGLAPSTVESYYRVLASVMKAAKDDRLIHESPCDKVSLPRAEGTKAALVPLSTEQVQAIACAVPARYRALVLGSAGLGLRQGEACGLTVDRVDFLRRTVRIDRQLLTPTSGPVRFGPTKTPSSNRVVALSSSVADELAAHLARFGAGEHGLLFTSSTGAPLRRSTWQAAFARAARDTGVDSSTHDLRHHCASLLISSGCSVTAVQHFLGHKTASETLDTYSHLWPNDGERIRAAIDAGFRKSEDQMRTASGLGH